MLPPYLLYHLRLAIVMVFLSISIALGQVNFPLLDRYRNNFAYSTTDSARAYWSINLGEAFLDYQNDSAIHYFQRAVQLADASKNQKIQRSAYLKLGQVYLFYTDFNKSIDLLNKAEKLGHSFPIDSIQVEIQIMQARAYRSSGQYDMGLRLCLALLKKYEHFQNRWPQPLALLNAELGTIHLHLRHFTESKKHFLKQLAISQKSKNKRLILSALGNLGTLYDKNNLFEEAEDCFRKSYEIALKANPPILLGYVYLNFGELAMHRKQYKAAIIYINLSLQYSDIYQIDRGYAYLMLANCYKANQQPLKSLQQINQAIRILHSTASLQPEQEALSLKAKLLAQIGQYKSAYFINERAYQFRDSLFGLEKEKSLSQIQANFDLERKQQQIVALKKNLTIHKQAQEKMQLQLKLANQQRLLYLLSLVLASIILGFAYYAYERQKRIGLLLGQQKEEISNQATQLAELNDTKDKLFSLISHDLRSPVARLKKQLSLLKSTHLPSELQNPISQLEVQADQLLSLLTNLLAWSYIQFKGLRANPKPVDLSSIIGNVLAQTNELISQKEIRIINQVSTSTWILADKIQIEAVIRNLVNNSIKFTPPKGFIRLSTEQINEIIILTIQDTGIGMTAEQLEKLFSAPDVRTGTAGEPGTGLGLRVCREMLGSQPDAIRIISKPDQGTRVSIRLSSCNEPELVVSFLPH